MYCQRALRHTYYCTTGTLLYYRYANACRPCTGSAAVQYYRYANGSCTGSAVLLMNYINRRSVLHVVTQVQATVRHDCYLDMQHEHNQYVMDTKRQRCCQEPTVVQVNLNRLIFKHWASIVKALRQERSWQVQLADEWYVKYNDSWQAVMEGIYWCSTCYDNGYCHGECPWCPDICRDD